MSAASSKTINERRLYVGNLARSVDEYTLVQLCSKYGKVTNADYLVHKTGEYAGQPRSYAFVEFSNEYEASQCIEKLNDKLFRGRKLTVTYAKQSAYSDYSGGRKGKPDASKKPTTLSLMKNQNKLKSTHDQIAALEAKIKSMENQDTSKDIDTEPSASTSSQRQNQQSRPHNKQNHYRSKPYTRKHI